MEKKLSLTCAKCGTPFEKALREYNRQIRNGRDKDYFFCSRSCVISNSHEHDVYDIEQAKKNLIPGNGHNRADALSPFRLFILRAKNIRRNNKRKTCDIKAEQLAEIFERQQGKCPLTGWDLELPKNTSDWHKTESIKRASLDRIDSSKGYTADNVRFVSVIANFAKNKYTDEDVIEFSKAVVGPKEHHISKACKADKLSSFKWFTLRARQRAKRNARKVCCIEPEFLVKLFEKQGGKCPFTGWDLVLPKDSGSWEKISIRNASLDRIDNSKGYIEDNVRFVSVIANNARNIYTDEDVVAFCQAVVDNS